MLVLSRCHLLRKIHVDHQHVKRFVAGDFLKPVQRTTIHQVHRAKEMAQRVTRNRVLTESLL